MNLDAIRAVLKEMRKAAEDAELWHGSTYAVNADTVDDWRVRIEAALTGADALVAALRGLQQELIDEARKQPSTHAGMAQVNCAGRIAALLAQHDEREK